MTIRTERQGRRTYLTGDTYHLRSQLRGAGFHWDASRKAWWTAKHDEAERIAAAAKSVPHPERGSSSSQKNDTPRDGDSSIVAGRATYKGRTYYIAGRVARGETSWDDEVEVVSTRDGAKVLLYFRDGSRQFWAARDQVAVEKAYRTPQTLGSLREYAEQAKKNRAAGRPAGAHDDDCRCRRCREEMADALEDQDYFDEAEAIRRGADWV